MIPDAEAHFVVPDLPDWGDKVQHDNLMPLSTLSPCQGLRIWLLVERGTPCISTLHQGVVACGYVRTEPEFINF
jgi:hypothetical protein